MSDRAVKHYVDAFEQMQESFALDELAQQRQAGIRHLQEQGFRLPARRTGNIPMSGLS